MNTVMRIFNEDQEQVCSFPIVEMVSQISVDYICYWDVTVSNQVIDNQCKDMIHICEDKINKAIKEDNKKIDQLNININNNKIKKEQLNNIKDILKDIYN